MRANSGKRLIAVLCVIAAGGCEATPATRLIDPFELIFSGETPVRIGINRVHIPLPPFFPKAPWGALQIGLAEAIQQPVHFEALNPLQIQHHLRSGRLAFALVNAVDYAEIATDDVGSVLAIACNRTGRTSRACLIIASAKSDVKSIADIKGQRFAFGPRHDPVLHVAAMATLARNGVGVDDLRKELLPLPGSLQFHISSDEAAKAVVYELGIVVGVVSEQDYEQWPEKGGSLLPLSFSRDQVRVLARSMDVPEIALLVSNTCDAELAKQVEAFLLDRDAANADMLAGLDIDHFEAGRREPYEEFSVIARTVPGVR